jgi:hypothetical protein
MHLEVPQLGKIVKVRLVVQPIQHPNLSFIHTKLSVGNEVGMMKEIKNGVQKNLHIFIPKFANNTKGYILLLKKIFKTMTVNKRLQEILLQLEDALSYKDWNLVEEVKDEVVFLIDDLDEGDFMDDHYDDEY